MEQFILIGMCIGIKMSTISPLFSSKCQHGQYRTLKVEYLSPMPAFTKIIVLYSEAETICNKSDTCRESKCEHIHFISSADVSIAIKKLKSDKVNDNGLVYSQQF